MANWSELKAAVANVIKTNGAQEITGQSLQGVLNNIISNVGKDCTFAGVATTSTNPGKPDGNVFYIAGKSGTYANFGGITVNSGEAAILEWRGSWQKKVMGLATSENMTSLSENMTSLNNALKGEPSAVSNNIRNAFIYLGNFFTWAEAQTELDKLHSQSEDNTKIGNFRILLNGRNIEVNNWVQNWAAGVFTQTVQGSIQWNDESQTMDQSLNINTYERRYNEDTGWTAWVKNVKDISEATEENSGLMSEDDKKKINSLPLTFTFLQYDEIVDGEGIYFSNATYEFDALTGRYKLKDGTDDSQLLIPIAGPKKVGLMSISDKKKLDALKPLTYIDHGINNTSVELGAFEYHRWGEISQIVLNVPNEPDTDGVINVYMFEFISGSTATRIAWPPHIKPSTNTIEANKTYQITIINNLATIKSFG